MRSIPDGKLLPELRLRGLQRRRVDEPEVDGREVLLEPLGLRRPDFDAPPVFDHVGSGNHSAQRRGRKVHLQVSASLVHARPELGWLNCPFQISLGL